VTHPSFIELPVDFSVVQGRRVSPFHWVLLKALHAFVPGARPDFDLLAERLRILERSFLNRAWAEIRDLKAADDGNFAQARLTVLGEDALRTRYFTLGEAELRTQNLHFKKQNGEALQTATFEVAVLRALHAKPEWCERIGDALAVQAPTQALKRGERIQNFTFRWQDAQEVKVTVGR
jgi:hypothetical protein